MKNYKILFLLTALGFLPCFVSAQDVILTTKNETIKAKVEEIGINEIKYRDFNNLDGPVIVIPKSDVKSIRYENGSTFSVNPDPYEVGKQDIDARKKTHVIKMEFFSPLTNDLAFGYETMLKVGTNLECKIGIIGIGFDRNAENSSGVFFKAGPKFLKGSDYVTNGLKYAHPMKGSYIKPEIIFNTYKVNKEVWSYNTSTTSHQDIQYTNLAFDIVFGKQYVLGGIMTLDYYFGLGYGFQNNNADSNIPADQVDVAYSYSHVYWGINFPLILTGGLTLGVLY
jgi:hypothetical protein